MKKRKIGTVLWGIFFILSAVFMVVAKLGYLQEFNIFSIMLGVICVGVAINGLIKLSFAEVFFPLSIIAIIFDKKLGLESLSTWTILLAALFLTIGFEMIFGAIKKNRYKNKFKANININSNIKPSFVDNFANEINVSMGATSKYYISEEFVKGMINASFSGVKVYFEGENLKEKTATIYINTLFSGVEIYVPRGWNIVDKTKTIMGGINIHNGIAGNEIGENTLYIEGNVTFGGCEIRRL